MISSSKTTSRKIKAHSHIRQALINGSVAGITQIHGKGKCTNYNALIIINCGIGKQLIYLKYQFLKYECQLYGNGGIL